MKIVITIFTIFLYRAAIWIRVATSRSLNLDSFYPLLFQFNFRLKSWQWTLDVLFWSTHHSVIWGSSSRYAKKEDNKCDEIATSLLTCSLHFMTACTNFFADMHTNVLREREILILNPHWDTKATEILHLFI